MFSCVTGQDVQGDETTGLLAGDAMGMKGRN